jgi:hypothetical protein
MAIAQIVAWLRSSDKNYQLGVSLYNEYGDKPLLKTLLNNGASDYHQQRLHEALEELGQRANIEPANQAYRLASSSSVPVLEMIPVPSKLFSLSDEEWNKIPDSIRDLYVANHRLKSRADLLFVQGRSAPTANERLKLALAQLDDRQQVNENWKLIKEFHTTGLEQKKIAQEQEVAVADMPLSEVLKLEKNIPTYITKATQRLQAMQAGTRAYDKTLTLLGAHKAKLKAVKERLANA